jgi:hypothetical protein
MPISSTSESALPNLGEIFAGVLQRIPTEQRPLLVAAAERIAAKRYRGWAEDSADPARKTELLACAKREEEIAGRVEALFPDAGTIQQNLLAQNRGLEDMYRSLFVARPLRQQFTIQAQGERLGAATWRAFASEAPSPLARETFLACAELEEQSARVLEALVKADE